MKASRFLCLILTSCILSACDKCVYTLTTTIHRDGACERELTFVTDTMSSELYQLTKKKNTGDAYWEISPNILERRDDLRYLNPYLPTNSNYAWQVTDSKDSLLHQIWISFRSVEDMSKYPVFRLLDQPIKSHSTFNKIFHWFYTDCTFTETFEGFSRFFSLPISDYMNNEEAQYWLTGHPIPSETNESPFEAKEYLDELEKKFWRYISSCWLNDMYDLIINNYDSLTAAPLSRAAFAARKKEFITYMTDNGYNLLNDDFDNGSGLDSFFGTDIYHHAIRNGALKDSCEHIEDFYRAAYPLYIDYCLRMPEGKLLNCSYGVSKEDGLHFVLTPARLLLGEYTISATTRYINWWVIILLALLLSVAISSAFYVAPYSKKRL